MTNEWREFLDYTNTPEYVIKNKKTTDFLGRFTSDMLRDFHGFSRILTILARGIIFHEPDGTLRKSDPYGEIERARRFLSAWCSIPHIEKKKPTEKDEPWRAKTDFGKYHAEFPEIVDEKGSGWLFRHVHNLSRLIDQNREAVNKCLYPLADMIDEWDAAWQDKVVHFQVPIFSETTKAGWSLSFDSAIADALVLGPLRTENFSLPETYLENLRKIKPAGVPENVLPTLAEYYFANKQKGSDWVVLPVTNVEAFLGSTALSRRLFPLIPKEFMERKPTALGVCAYRVLMPTENGQ